jgi:hypothetical protein
MKRNSLKKAVSVFLAGTILLGFAACDFGGASKKAVLEAAETLASDMASASASKLIKNSTLDKKSDEAAQLTDLLEGGDYSDDQLAFFKAVEGTIEYEIDEQSVSVNKNEASVDIKFTIADYADVLKDEFTSIDELTSAIKKADTKEVSFTAEFEKQDKEWIPSNVGGKKFIKFYDYRNAEFTLELTAEMIAAFIDRTMSDFWLASGGKYTNTNFIEYDYYFDSEVYEYAERGIYLNYRLLKDGSVVFTSEDILFGESTNISCRIESTDLGIGAMEAIEAGKYTIELVNKDGDVIDSVSIDVEYVPQPSGNGGGGNGGGGNTSSGEGVYFDYYDASFKNYVIEADWYDYDGYMTGANTYSSDVLTIAFSIQVTSDCTKQLTYFYAWTDKADGDAVKDALNNPLYTGTASPVQYTNGTFYDFDYPVNGNAQKGYYMLVVSDASGIILYGYCQVS